MNAFIRKSLFLCILILSLLINCSFNYNFESDSYKKINTIKVVMDDDCPPYVFKDSSGHLQGITIDQWKLFEMKTGIKVEIHAMNWDKAQKLMERGQFDVIDRIFPNEKRAQIYDFSKPYAETQVPVFFNKNISGINGVETLKGFSVAVKKGDYSVHFLKEKGITDFKEFDSYKAIIDAAKNHEIVTFIMDKPSALYYIYKTNIKDNFNYSAPLYNGEFHRAVRKGNTNLLNIIENGFSLISSSEYKQIDEKWLGTPPISAEFMNYMIIVSIIIISVILLLVILNRMLNKKVKQKTSQLTKLIDQLKNSENRIKALFKALPDMVFVISPDGIFLDYHHENVKEFYVSPKEFIGKSLSDIFAMELTGKFMKSIANLFKTGETQIEEYSLNLHDEIHHFEARFVQCDANSIMVIVRDITEGKNTANRIYEMSMHDNLTGLNNRNYFENKLKIYENETEDLSNFAMVICDLDGLKLVNDTLGHSVGDEYLCTVANILRSCFRKQDVIARIGGDEFGILMNNTSQEEIKKIKTNINKNIEHVNSSNNLVPFSISFGYEIYKKDYKNLNEMFKEADNYMYREKLHNHQSTKSEIVQVLMKMLEARDFITEGHGERLQELASKLAESVGMSDAEINDMSLLAQFHDIGKVGISDAILFKPGKLNEEEASEMKKHTEIGYRIAKSSPDLMHISDWIFKHHEWWNGEGYPVGLKGDDIPIQCRILSIVDAYDAMTNDRPYRKALKKETAVAELKRCAGIQFDPILVDKFIDILNED
ncbi:diguanylate cyclase domain-containing protein [Clostridium sp. ZS2-4]|uniref:diguanylate cyclase domain-containing protein n=1 Tax=Clostridium sp. ZS2-4 TaxID=2987703 RepID=UPI00227A2CA5|nr:transporter substrate-binding domain-containing protein [Clostridium sp. ZS2-4]MCY6354150.1 transporter substrate-binding domain-containing protein [Clostridium sp. ZS2-4]